MVKAWNKKKIRAWHFNFLSARQVNCISLLKKVAARDDSFLHIHLSYFLWFTSCYYFLLFLQPTQMYLWVTETNVTTNFDPARGQSYHRQKMNLRQFRHLGCHFHDGSADKMKKYRWLRSRKTMDISCQYRHFKSLASI